MFKSIQKYKSSVLVFNLIIFVLAALMYFTLGQWLELKLYDVRAKYNLKPADPNIVLVGIDQTTLDQSEGLSEIGLGRFPWPRTAYSKVLKYISSGNPKAIVLDLEFRGEVAAERDSKFSDDTFIKEISNIPDVYIIHSLSVNEKELIKGINPKDLEAEKSNLFAMGPGKLLNKFFVKVEDRTLNDKDIQQNIAYFKMPRYIDGIYKITKGLGIANIYTDETDGVLRKYNTVYKYNHKYFLSLPFAVTRGISLSDIPVILENNKFIFGNTSIPIDNYGAFYLNWRRVNPKNPESLEEKNFYHQTRDLTYKSIPFLKLFLMNGEGEGVNPAHVFKDKIVLLGATSAISKDYFKTPVANSNFGLNILATSIDNVLNDKTFIYRIPVWANILVAIILVAISSIIFLYFLSYYKHGKATLNNAIVYYLLCLILYTGINLFLFSKMYIWVDIVGPILLSLIAISNIGYVTLLSEKDRRDQVENTFSKYVSPQIYQTLLQDYNIVSLSAKRSNISVLFSDIREFTPFTEALEPEEVAKYLNEYFNAMVAVILRNNGTVDKFMGDAIMAFFGAPLPQEEHALNAVKSAIEMKQTIQDLNKKWLSEGRTQLNIGVGINTGMALVGNFGADNLMDFTTIGDTVNLASRLESLNKEEGTNILISQYTYELVKDNVEVRLIGPKTVKGKSEAVVVYELLEFKPSDN